MISKSKGLNILGQALLFSATVVWGSSFIILKETISGLPSLYVIGVRFLSSAIVFGLIFIKRIVAINVKTLVHGVIIGLCLSFAYIAQTKGLEFLDAGKNAFITSLYCVMCPFFVWLFTGEKPKINHLVSALMCVAGICLIVIAGKTDRKDGEFLGMALTALGAVFFALQIVFTAKFHKSRDDVFCILFLELATAGAVVSLSSIAFELPFCGISAYALNTEQLLNILYLTVACTLFAQGAQLFGLKYVSPNQGAIILTLESAFGVLFAVILGDERVSLLLLIGFAVIFAGTLLSELSFDGKRIKHGASSEKTDSGNADNNAVADIKEIK